MNTREANQTPLTPTRIWPPPWWSVASTVILLGVIGALAWVTIKFTSTPITSTELPTPVLLIATSASKPPTPIDSVPLTAKQFSAGDLAQVSGTQGLDLRIRAGPGTLYETTKLVPEGTLLEITGEPRQADNYLWWPVKDPTDNTQGWVVSDYLEKIAP